MTLSLLLYAGVSLVVGGLVLLIFGRTRRSGARAAIAGVFAVLVAIAWPARESRVETRRARIDDFMPVWQFDETHTAHVKAPPERVFAAAHAVTAHEILLFRTLTAIRRGGRPLPPGILNAPQDEPLLDITTRTSFRYLADEAPREIVVATRVARGVDAVMNFLIIADGHGGSNLSTETRIFADSARGRREFAVYWRVIRPGSGIIRRMWLRAIKRRAEGA